MSRPDDDAADRGDGIMDRSQPGPEEPSALPAWRTSPEWWFRRIGLPLLAVIVIAGVIIWLERPGEDPRRTATGDESLAADGGAPQEGSPAPDFALSTLDGREVRLRDYQGSVVLLNFWATWCHPCRDEMPLLEAAQQEYADRGLVVLAVNVGEGSSTVRPFVDRLALTYDIALDEKSSIARRYRVRNYPTTYFIDRDGVVEGRRVGAYTRQILYGRLSQLLDE